MSASLHSTEQQKKPEQQENAAKSFYARHFGDKKEKISKALKSTWKIVSPFWRSEHKKIALLMLAGIGALTVAEIGVAAGVAYAMKFTLDALIAKNVIALGTWAASAIGLIVVNSGVTKIREYSTKCLEIRWRGWLSEEFQHAWLGDKTHYKMNNNKKGPYKADQRIASDTRILTDKVLGLGMGFIGAVISVATFSGMLMQFSPFMVWAAAGFSGLTSLVGHKIGAPLQKANNDFQGAEADYRLGLVRVNNNSEQIASRDFENIEGKILAGKLQKVVDTEREKIRLERNLGLFNEFNSKVASIVPILLAAPQVLSGTMTIGDVELARESYTKLFNSMSWFTYCYPSLAETAGAIERLTNFQDAIEDTKNKAPVEQVVTEIAPVDVTQFIRKREPVAPLDSRKAG